MTEKLQKILSRAGIASRRALEQMIDEGRVSVNGKVATLGDRYEAREITVSINGKVVLTPEQSNRIECRVLMYHKPEGELTTLSDPENRPTVFDHIPKPPVGKWIYIGRLDINTSGLLLFTTDGELANALMHPKYEVERVYAARIYGEVSDEQIDAMISGVQLDDGKARFSRIVYQGGEGRNAWYHVTLKEGRKREVRRLWEAVGLKVSRLIRIKYAGISLDPNVKSGQFRELSLNEINKLRRTVHLPPIEESAPSLDLKNAASSTRGRKKNKAEGGQKAFGRARPFGGLEGKHSYDVRYKKNVYKADGSADFAEDRKDRKGSSASKGRQGSGSSRKRDFNENYKKSGHSSYDRTGSSFKKNGSERDRNSNRKFVKEIANSTVKRTSVHRNIAVKSRGTVKNGYSGKI